MRLDLFIDEKNQKELLPLIFQCYKDFAESTLRKICEARRSGVEEGHTYPPFSNEDIKESIRALANKICPLSKKGRTAMSVATDLWKTLAAAKVGFAFTSKWHEETYKKEIEAIIFHRQAYSH